MNKIIDMAKSFNDLKIRQKKSDCLIGVLAGGISSERDISIKTGNNIFDSLKRSGYAVSFIDLKDDNAINEIKKIDMAFLALHGRYGEDGSVQGLLELLKIPYTGSGILSSALVMDKILSKKIMIMENIPTPDFIEIDLSSGDADIGRMDADIRERIGYPIVIKPNAEGSTIGISCIKSGSGLEDAINEAAAYDKNILIEKYIDGRELTVGVVGKEPVALPMIEIRPESGFFDYEAKYTENMTEYIIPPEMGNSLYKRIQEISLICHKKLSCCGISRIDFILDDNEVPYVLEANTMPGMTSTSLVPMAAAAASIKFDHLIEIILDSVGLKIR